MGKNESRGNFGPGFPQPGIVVARSGGSDGYRESEREEKTLVKNRSDRRYDYGRSRDLRALLVSACTVCTVSFAPCKSFAPAFSTAAPDLGAGGEGGGQIPSFFHPGERHLQPGILPSSSKEVDTSFLPFLFCSAFEGVITSGIGPVQQKKLGLDQNPGKEGGRELLGVKD